MSSAPRETTSFAVGALVDLVGQLAQYVACTVPPNRQPDPVPGIISNLAALREQLRPIPRDLDELEARLTSTDARVGRGNAAGDRAEEAPSTSVRTSSSSPSAEPHHSTEKQGARAVPQGAGAPEPVSAHPVDGKGRFASDDRILRVSITCDTHDCAEHVAVEYSSGDERVVLRYLAVLADDLGWWCSESHHWCPTHRPRPRTA